MNDAKNYLANFIAFIYAYADPDIVILGGSVALKIDGFVEEVEELVKQKLYDVMLPYIKVRKTTLDENSGLLGAAFLGVSPLLACRMIPYNRLNRLIKIRLQFLNRQWLFVQDRAVAGGAD